ncbi:MAG TPA: glycosyltransferase family 87 protein [Candidatus Saccharimonadales bacterium]|nr:glycosyltransferase family 87 protein [Candidatus Saccharimonadales bacterium]
MLRLALACVAGPIAIALASVRYAVTFPQSTDFAGVAATHQAQATGLGCIYSRSVQLAGLHLVPGAGAPPLPADLIWHFNEPPLMTLFAAPFAALRLATAVNLWEVVLWVALAACGFLLWRSRSGLPPWLTAAVIAGLLLNEIANTEFGLAQNDALLLVPALLALELLRRHEDVGAGVLLGLVALKPQLIFLAVIALLIHHRWRLVAACAATVAAIGATSILMVGPSCSLQWLGSATQLEEFQIGIGLPGTLARWTGSATAAEIAFVIFAIISVAVLICIRRRIDTHVFVAVAIALAVVIGLHTLAYDVLFLAPLGMAVARSKPWAVIAAGWGFTVAQLIYPDGPAPILATELVPFVAVTLAVVFIVRSGTPSEENPGRINAASHRQLVAAT